MPTALFAKARTAGVIALALLTIASVAVPAQAARLRILEGSDLGQSDSRHDCDSRRELKYFLQSEYDFKQVEVRNTHDDYIYKVSALAPVKKAEAFVLKDHSSDYTRYVFLFDACDHAVIEWIKPAKSPTAM